MKKAIITICLIGSAIIILITSGFFNSLLLFLLVGKLPGLPTALTAETMQVVTALGIAMLIFVGFKRNRQQLLVRLIQLEKSLRTISSVVISRQNRLRP